MSNVINMQTYKARIIQERALNAIKDEFKNSLHHHSGAQITNEQYETLIDMMNKGFMIDKIRYVDDQPIIVVKDSIYTSLVQPDGIPITYTR